MESEGTTKPPLVLFRVIGAGSHVSKFFDHKEQLQMLDASATRARKVTAPRYLRNMSAQEKQWIGLKSR